MKKCKLHNREGFCLDCISISFGDHVGKFVEKGELMDVMRWATHADNTSIQKVLSGITKKTKVNLHEV